MITVFDTSPLCHLLLIGEIEIVPRLFGTATIPGAVAEELTHRGAPQAVREWLMEPPAWLAIEKLENASTPATLKSLHRGECEAILLARKLTADWLVIDEKAARRAARDLGLRVTGLIGLLGQAARRNLVDLPTAVRRLESTHFHVSPKLLRELLDEARE